MNFKKESYLILLILIIYLKTFSYANDISESSSESESKENFSDLEIEVSTAAPGAEVSKSTMDIITVIWYLSTFLALAAFFFLMACSDRRCGRQRLPQEPNTSNLICPPTPAPSYSEFAPPSYESVVKHPHIYVIPIEYKIETVNEKNNKTSQSDYKSNNQVNDLQKNC